MKGIILAGGSGTRLYPLTKGQSKQLLAIHDKPMIYYPLSVLMLAGIRDILIISTPRDLPRFKDLFKNGQDIGLNISYKEQPNPNGIAEAFVLGADFIEKSDLCLILGDNIFYGKGLNELLNEAMSNLDKDYSTIFSVEVENPTQFGVIEFSEDNKIKRITEKPNNTDSKSIVSGLYFYTNEVVQIAKNLEPSKRNELEITDVNNNYLKKGKLKSVRLDSSFSWSDTGTYDSLIKASKFYQEIEYQTGNKVACIEEIALKKGFINKSEYIKIANSMIESNYGKYLLRKSKDY